MKIKNHKLMELITINVLVITSLLFIYVPQGYAQEDQDWTPPVNLSLSGIATDPMLVIDSDEVLHAIWVDAVDGYQYSQSADGVTWTKSQTVKYPFTEELAPPVMLSDADESIYVFWIGRNSTLFYTKTSPASLPNPSQWQSIRLAQDVTIYDVVLDSQGALHVAYIYNKSTAANPAGIYYRQSIVGGGSWSNNIKLYESEYFRSAIESESFVRIATSNNFPDQNVYVVWDDRPQKRIFMAVSNDSGLSWNEAQKIKGVEDTDGIGTPFNFNVAAVNNKVLIMWQEGEPGIAQCTTFSQWSENNGESWGDSISLLGSHFDCPVNSKFIIQKEDYIVAMLTGQVNPILVAWNGERWSEIQMQMQLPAISNPLTYDTVMLGCRFDLVHQNHIYVVGCDQGEGGDIWFLSRSLEPVKNWFSLQEDLEAHVVISEESKTILSLSSVSDIEGGIHSIWVQSALSDDGIQKATMRYSHWGSKGWTRPGPVMSFSNIPRQLSFASGPQKRLFLSWVDGDSGDLLFSWAYSEHANLASEWAAATTLPSLTNLVSSPDIVVNG